MHLSSPCMNTLEIFTMLKDVVRPGEDEQQLPNCLKTLFSEFYAMLVNIRMGNQAMKVLENIRSLSEMNEEYDQSCLSDFIKDIGLYFMDDRVGNNLMSVLSLLKRDQYGRTAGDILQSCEQLLVHFEGESVDERIDLLIQKVRIYESLITVLQSDNKIDSFEGKQLEKYQYYLNNQMKLSPQKLIMVTKLQNEKRQSDKLERYWSDVANLGVNFQPTDTLERKLLQIDEFIREKLELCTHLQEISHQNDLKIQNMHAIMGQHSYMSAQIKVLKSKLLKQQRDIEDMLYEQNLSCIKQWRLQERIITLEHELGVVKRRCDNYKQKEREQEELKKKYLACWKKKNENFNKKIQELVEKNDRLSSALSAFFNNDNKSSYELSSVASIHKDNKESIDQITE